MHDKPTFARIPVGARNYLFCFEPRMRSLDLGRGRVKNEERRHTSLMVQRIQLRVLRAFLWIIRIAGFDLPLNDGQWLYEWVQTPDGRFDHWIASPDEQFNLSDILQQIGFARFLFQILTASVLIVRMRQRRRHKESCRLVGTMYACHGKRELLPDKPGTSDFTVLNACKWIVRSIEVLDQLPDQLGKSRDRVAAWNLREAALALLKLLASQDQKIAALLETAFPPTLPRRDPNAPSSPPIPR